MAHIRITRPFEKGSETQVLNVNKIGADGEIKPYTCFVNKLTPRENMITLCLMEHHIGNILDERMRAKYANEIKIGFQGKLLIFFIGDETFITAPVTDEKATLFGMPVDL